jgi:AraC family transcriptional regulator
LCPKAPFGTCLNAEHRQYLNIFIKNRGMAAVLSQGKYFGLNIKSRENEFVKLSITSYEPHHVLAEHYHENSYISILMTGSYVERNREEKISVQPGDILFRPAGYNHGNSFMASGGRCFNIEFKKDWGADMDIHIDLPDTYQLYRPGTDPSLYRVISGFMNDNQWDMGVEAISNWLFNVNKDVLKRSSLRWIDGVKAILENEMECVHSIQSLSERVFIHPVYLSGAFKKRTGLTVGEYQKKVKLSHAVNLLIRTPLPINDIALRCGFFDNAHFGRFFKSVHGISPGKFRLALKS